MTWLELLILAVGLSMDAAAVAIGLGLSLSRTNFKNAVAVGLYFGGFQGLMPLAGYFAATFFSEYFMEYANWIAFALLAFLGGKMILGSFRRENFSAASLSPRKMLPLALATSIDALAVGVSFAFLEVRIVPAVSIIAAVTFGFSAIGVRAGGFLGGKFKNKAAFAGGVILILIGLRILIGG